MSSDGFFCFKCQKEIVLIGKTGRRDECPHCRADVHVCKNCEFYDVKAYNECREPSADVVVDKERANFCDYFTPVRGSRGGVDTAAALRAAAEALFKKN